MDIPFLDEIQLNPVKFVVGEDVVVVLGWRCGSTLLIRCKFSFGIKEALGHLKKGSITPSNYHSQCVARRPARRLVV
jgi:hypothetical protein